VNIHKKCGNKWKLDCSIVSPLQTEPINAHVIYFWLDMAKHRVIYTLNVTHFIMVPDTFWTVNNYFVHSQPPSKTNLSSKAQQHHSIISHKTAKQNSLNKYNSNSRHTSLTPASVDYHPSHQMTRSWTTILVEYNMTTWSHPGEDCW
jgi:hypothetical protein